jgi:L-threonylcarbamoyladenylate synthase
LSVSQLADSTAQIEQAAALLVDGKLVAFPTETVYGLGADATNSAAVAQIFALKGRPSGHPVIVHLPSGADPADYFARAVPDIAYRLIERFWPGPLTLILARQHDHAEAAAGGQPSIGLRCPDHRLAQQLLQCVAALKPHAGLAAPSANRFGHVSPTTAEHVLREFSAELTVLDGGPCRIGIESTIVDLSRYHRLGAVLLRPGEVSRAALAEVLGHEPASIDGDAPRASGTLASHYAPSKPVRLVLAGELDGLEDSVAVWAFHAAPARRASACPWLQAPVDAHAYASAMYAVLRQLDLSPARSIAIERPPNEPAWEAVNDRLRRAAAA